MTPFTLISLFFLTCAVGILSAIAVRPEHRGGVFAWIGGIAAVAAFAAGAESLLTGHVFERTLWPLPDLTILTLRLDPLSAVFVLATGMVLLPVSIYAGSELNRGSLQGCERPVMVMLFGLYAAILLILISGDAVLFLLAWELMSILCYLLVINGSKEDNDRLVGSGYLLLAMGEAGTVAVAVGFLLLASGGHSLEFEVLKSAAYGLDAKGQWAVFLLTFFGFGVKAGLVPVNSWVRQAYAAAPRAFAPVLAGATLNLGLYGILRVNVDFLPPTQAGPGMVMLIVGSASALIGILYATTDNDLKAVLAHSSIENVGITVAGFGAGALFLAAHHPAIAAIAFIAALYHLVNHSLYKSLLFIGVGAVETQTGTRDIDRLGGLIRWMPVTALAFLVGALSIAGLPPFNGFVSEWLTLQALLRSSELSSTEVRIVFALCGAGLALTAALAITCFVKMFAMTFLGMHRSGENTAIGEPARATLYAAGILAVLCLAFGVLPTYVVPLLDPASVQLTGASAVDGLIPAFFNGHQAYSVLPPAFVSEFHDLGAQVGQGVIPGRGLVVLHRGGIENPVVFAMSSTYLLLTLTALLALTWAVRKWITRDRRVVRGERWAGGVRQLLPEMTYTGTGFSNPVRVVFDAIFRPTTVLDTSETVVEHFRTAIRRERIAVYVMDRLMLQPVRNAVMGISRVLAVMHHGRINAYTAYVLLAMLAALLAGLI